MKASFFDLPDFPPEQADVLFVSLPFDGSVSYGKGTSRAPEAIRRASVEIELWDEEVDWNLERLKLAALPPILPQQGESPAEYQTRTRQGVTAGARESGLVVGIGGDHSVTAPLVHASANSDDLSDITVVQFDAHADLREEYLGSRESHACVMRRVIERGARVLAVGVRSVEEEEADFERHSSQVETFAAQDLWRNASSAETLIRRLRTLQGKVYVTFDVDAFEVALCPGTGTPQPGGLGWWQARSHLRALLFENTTCCLIGFDVVEVVPQPHTQVNEVVAARLVSKILAYAFANPS